MARVRGSVLKRYLRSVAALHARYEDTDLAADLGVSRNTVGAWWMGAKMQPETIKQAADRYGLPLHEVLDFVQFDGPAPSYPEHLMAGFLEGVLLAEQRLIDEARGTPPRSRVRPRDDS